MLKRESGGARESVCGARKYGSGVRGRKCGSEREGERVFWAREYVWERERECVCGNWRENVCERDVGAIESWE